MTTDIRVIVLLCCIALTSACGHQETPPLRGYLYFGAGSYLGAFNLQSGEAEPVSNFGDREITWVNPLDDDELLVSVIDRRVNRSLQRIVRYDPARDRTVEFMLGSRAVYLPGSNVIVFDDGGTVAAVSRRAVSDSPTVLAPGERGSEYGLLVIADTTVLLGTEGNGETSIRRVDVDTGESHEMPELASQCNLLHAAWIADDSAVLCAMPSPPHRYRLVGLDGRKMDETSIPPDRDFRALTYLSHSRAVVFTEVRPSLMSDLDQRDVWVYWLDTDELRLLAAGQNLGRSVAYRRWRF